MKLLPYSMFIFLFAFSCSSVKMDKPEDARTLVELDKSACFGDCKQYHLELNTDGTLIYTGKKNVDKIGVYKAQLTKKQYKEIINSIDVDAINRLDNQYNTDIVDGQFTTLIYHGENKEKKIRSVYDFPDAMKSVTDNLEKIADGSVDWIGIDVPNVDTEEEPVIIKSDKPTRRIISYDQGACFGTCATFSIEILTDQSALYVGKRYVDKEGIYEKKLSDRKYQELVSLFNSEEFYDYDAMYDKNIMDAQTFTMKFYDENNVEKSVKTKITQTELMKQIISEMQNLVDSKGWEKKENEDSTVPVEETILISLNPQVKAKTWVESKEHLGLKIERFLSPNGTYFLVSYDKERDINRVMEELRRDKMVLNVSRGDRAAKPRGGNMQNGSNRHGKVNIKDKN